jgi:diacylglycerol kinase family enzyme
MSKKPSRDVGRTRVGVIVHSEKQLGAGLEELRAALADLGHADPPWYEVDKSRKAPKQVRKLIEDDGVERLLVWGGDGTVRRCLDAVVSGGHADSVAIGILPAGTANLLAHNLDIPLELRPAVENALHGEPRRIDVGLVNGRDHFAVMAGAGFDAMLIADADDTGAKERWGRLGYVMAGARNMNISPAEAIVTVDGDPWYKGPAASVIAGNVGSLFGGLCAFPSASPTDGRLDVGVATARTRAEWARLFGAAVTHRIEASPFVEQTSGRTITVEFDRTLPWQADGGDQDRLDRFEFECVPNAIAVCQPRRTVPKDHS